MFDNRTMLFALHEIRGVGWKSIRNIVDNVPELHLLTEENSLIDTKVPQLLPHIKELIKQQLSARFIKDRLKIYRDANTEFITIWDEDYPELLQQTSQPPWVLYCKGKRSLLFSNMMAIVGTRTPTSYGKRAAGLLSSELAKSGICVVSGMARGIDSEAHWAALREVGSTIAVLGTGLDIVYPAEHVRLYKEIANHGLLVSEFPLGASIHPGNFPLRNRVIAGLSLGTVVVEAAAKSGSLITADLALSESREVFAVPGPITSPKSKGTHALIKQGAKIVTSAEDILEEFQHMITLNPIAAAESPSAAAFKLSAEESRIMDLLSVEPTTIDQLLEQSKIPFGHLHAILLSLTLKKQIEQVPGSAYVTLF